jgi:ribonuclease Z
MDMRHVFVTHKHVDHLMGIIWMVRMICQFMNDGETIILNGSPRKTGILQ